jgi:hypothetical protein
MENSQIGRVTRVSIIIGSNRPVSNMLKNITPDSRHEYQGNIEMMMIKISSEVKCTL